MPGGRAWDVAAILVSWFGGLLLVGDAATVRGLSDDATFLHFVAGCVLSLALWWRRRHPITVTIFLTAASVVADGAGIAALIGLYTVISLRRGRPVVLLVLFNLIGGIAYALIYPDPTLPPAAGPVVGFMLTVAILAATVALGMAARSRRELVESLRERAARAEAEAALRAERHRALERERIAREMHDALAHRISMVSLHAGALQIRPDLTPEEVAKAAATIRDSAHHALEDLREILGVLRAGPGDSLRPQPDVSHLGDLISEARAAGVQVTATNRLGDRPLSASLGRTVYRLVQEGLTNAGKHAPGSPVTLLLDQTTTGELRIHVSNPLPLTSRRPTTPGVRPGSRSSLPASGSSALRSSALGSALGSSALGSSPSGSSASGPSALGPSAQGSSALGSSALGSPSPATSPPLSPGETGSHEGGPVPSGEAGFRAGGRGSSSGASSGSGGMGSPGEVQSGEAGLRASWTAGPDRGPAVTSAFLSGIGPAVTSAFPSGIGPAVTSAFPSGIGPAVTSAFPSGIRPAVTSASPFGIGPAVTSASPSGIGPAVTSAFPSGIGPAGSGAESVIPGAGSGLVGLAERVELAGGRLRHGVRGDPRAGLTFDLEAWLPWPTPSGS
ncbi:histidine kinase [Actinoplanes subglobosus]|uniref:histidine kinase n=1 Tax=Actinoplanes subglobosus TaxID=1547892 RepID=A0ABV8J9N6_9ACTN